MNYRSSQNTTVSFRIQMALKNSDHLTMGHILTIQNLDQSGIQMVTESNFLIKYKFSIIHTVTIRKPDTRIPDSSENRTKCMSRF